MEPMKTKPREPKVTARHPWNKRIHQRASDPFAGIKLIPTWGSKSRKTIGKGPIKIVHRNIPTAIFFLLLP